VLYVPLGDASYTVPAIWPRLSGKIEQIDFNCTRPYDPMIPFSRSVVT
jgi:hypothetical protein